MTFLPGYLSGSKHLWSLRTQLVEDDVEYKMGRRVSSISHNADMFQPALGFHLADFTADGQCPKDQSRRCSRTIVLPVLATPHPRTFTQVCVNVLTFDQLQLLQLIVRVYESYFSDFGMVCGLAESLRLFCHRHSTIIGQPIIGSQYDIRRNIWRNP